MHLPNFLVVGAQKSGTTSLHEILSEHPQINMSKVKEINFFTLDKNYQKGVEFYSSFFDSGTLEDPIAIGESSPGYMCYPGVAEKIKKDLGNIKIVMILRDPIKRAFSQYWDNRRQLSEPLNEQTIVDRYLNENYSPGERGYFSRGVYINYIKVYERNFGRRNLYIMFLEDLISNPKEQLQNLYSFIGVDINQGFQTLPNAANSSKIYINPFYSFLFKHNKYCEYLPVHARRFFLFGKEKIFKYQLPEDSILKEVKAFYKPFNEELENYLDRKLDKWLK